MFVDNRRALRWAAARRKREFNQHRLRRIEMTTETRNTMHAATTRADSRIPLAVKMPYTLFVALVVPYYWVNYGPANFFYFCDIALLATLAALWFESGLLASMQGVSILLPQTVWMVDFFSAAVLHKSPLGMTAYMFDSAIPLFVRGLSTFHLWLPILLVWLVWRLGYERKAFALQVLCGWAVLLMCYFLLPAPPAPAGNPSAAVNINYVYGPSDAGPEQWVHPQVWLAMLMILFPMAFYLPTHLVLAKLFGRRKSR
jgi:hypothetical protein